MKITSSAAVSAKCDLCESESDNIVIGLGAEGMKYYCHKHYQIYETNLKKKKEKKK